MAASTVLSLIVARASISPHAVAAYHRAGDSWRALSLSQLLGSSELLATALLRSGLRPGDRLAIVCRTRLEWLVAELAALAAGLVVVGIDAHASTAQITRILQDSEVSGLIVDAASDLSRIPLNIRERLSLIVAIDPSDATGLNPDPGVVAWPALTGGRASGIEPASTGRQPSGVSAEVPSWRYWTQCTGGNAATLLYTSGTTGAPKGIVYRHEQLAIACESILDAFPIVSTSKGSTICWLPMAALFQRMMNYVALASGVTIYFVENPAHVVDTAREIAPTYFVGVPRFFEKLHIGIQQALIMQPGWKRKLVGFARACSRTRRSSQATATDVLKARLLDVLVLKRMRRILGGRLSFMITGSAPMPAWLLEYFCDLGILVLEAYAVSEDSVPIAANRPDSFRFGSVGQIFPTNEVRLGDDGEVLIRGPGVFDGYSGPPVSQVKNFTEDGFYRTGDLGRFDADRFLYLVGRKSDIFKTSTGRRIVASRVESIYKQIPYVEQIVVIAHGRPYPVALLSVNACSLASTMSGHLSPAPVGDQRGAILSSAAVRARIAADMEAIASELGSYERVRKFDLLAEPLSIEREELTPSLKLRRDSIESRHAARIERLYRESSSAGPRH